MLADGSLPAYKSGGLGVGGSNPPSPTSKRFWQKDLQVSLVAGDFVWYF